MKLAFLFIVAVLMVRQTAPAAPPLALCVPATIVKVHDGDTATEVTLQVTVQVRYLNCWAPELKDKGGVAARDSAKRAEGMHGRLFIPIGNANNLSDLLTFGRVLGEFWPDGAKESESQRQVRLKHASTTKGGSLGK